jgi:signal transduction histidine kinase
VNGAAAPSLDSPVGDETRRTNQSVHRAWDTHDGLRHHGLGVPLVGRAGGNIGSIEVVRAGDVAFDREDEDLLVQLAHMTSIAVENAVFSEAREANRLKDEFIAAVSHELRTPLNALRSWAWVLRQNRLAPKSGAGGRGDRRASPHEPHHRRPARRVAHHDRQMSLGSSRSTSGRRAGEDRRVRDGRRSQGVVLAREVDGEP